MVKHILKDGTVLETIEGHVVRKEDVPEIYKRLKAGKEQ